ncbi:hypothetical protein RHMOL_Rhmol07G0017800 [Rhododendron molle]|uniref:Uncharacterized protein n=2 Tax=Rhododendron molle TaxID=49168 RepID=A0ACC0MVQ4_RHOML|nr:hypothetical protein RHMOL_Rhmol07G0017800 [Rhododendron molle]KAI8545119.1 hypothetical protein RHMOL_Rhmol07G0017800 [Rhododendron molle]
MDSFSTSDENSHPGYQSSLSSTDQTDHSPTRTTLYSVLSTDSFAYYRTNSEISCFSELTTEESSDLETPSLAWLLTKSPKLDRRGLAHVDYDPVDLGDKAVELETMKERFSKLLLGEDMSGSGRGVCTAVAISNAMTNLYASVFGNHLRLEPLHPEKKLMWRREMNCLLSVCDYIVELVPKSKDLHDGTTLEVMAGMPRSDIYINLPALRKLDTMLLEILEGFQEMEFWYVEQGSMSGNSSRPGSFRRIVQPLQRQEEKWWLPVPCVPSGGLSEKSRKHLRHKRDCAKQIQKAAMAINGSVLAEMEIPDTYLASLPKASPPC